MAGCAASHSQSTAPSPASGLTVKYPVFDEVRFWKKCVPCEGLTVKSRNPASTIARTPAIWSHETGMPRNGSLEPQRPTPTMLGAKV